MVAESIRVTEKGARDPMFWMAGSATPCAFAMPCSARLWLELSMRRVILGRIRVGKCQEGMCKCAHATASKENGRVPRKMENTQLQISLFWCGRGCRDLGRGPEPGCWSLPAFQTCTMQSFGLQSDASESFCLPCAIATAAGFSWSAWLILEMTLHLSLG